MVKRRGWFLYVAAMTPVSLLYLFGPKIFNRGPVFNAIGASAVVVIVLGVRLHRPAERSTWYLIAAAQALFVAGDVVAYNYQGFFHHELPYPSAADALYLSVYPCLILGVLLLIRKRTPGGDRSALIDSLVVVIGLGALSWRFFMAPYATDATLGLLTKLVSIAYPLMDILVLGVLVRLAIGGGHRERSFYLLGIAFASLLVTDSVFGYLLLNGGYETGGVLDAGWMAFYILLGAAALHPSMRVLSDPRPEQEVRFGRGRLVLLASGAVATPTTAFILSLLNRSEESTVFVASSIALFLLVVWRMAGLVRKNAESVKQERALREAGGDLVTATSRDGIYAATLTAAKALSGRDTTVLIGSPLEGGRSQIVADSSGKPDGWIERLPEWASERIDRGYWIQIQTSEVFERESLSGTWLMVTPLIAKGSTKGLLVVASPEPLPSSTKDALTVLGTQVSLAVDSAHLTEDLLRRQGEARFTSLVQNSSDIVTVVSPDSTIRYMSPSVKRILGYDPADLEGTTFISLVRPEDVNSVLVLIERASDDRFEGIEFGMRRSDGSWTYVEMIRTNLMHEPSVAGIVLNTRDISERKAFEEQLSQQAFSDSITGLANRALLRDRMAHALHRQERSRYGLALLFIDLDDFKTINDSLGHGAGDQLLKKVGDRIRDCLRSSDTPARLGGDEFAVLLEDREDEAGVLLVADRVLDLFKEPFLLDGTEVFLSSSIGISFAGSDEHPAVDDLLRNADVAMYTAKQAGKGRYQIFEPAMHEAVMKRLELKADLQRAVENKEFQLVYQPVMDLKTMRVRGVEALVRWHSPKKGLVSPADFIPLAEETGLIVPIGTWVMEEACRHVKLLGERVPGAENLIVSVNVSARQLQRPEIIDEVARTLRATGLPASRLVIEITESLMMQDMALAELRMSDLKKLGVTIAVDDFGTGYSSLNYIRQFPVDILKIDKSFIDGLGADQGESLVGTILDLARVLTLQPIAEGVESEDQVTELLRLGCTLAQGYYFAQPLKPEAIEEMLRQLSTPETGVRGAARV